MFLIGPVYGVIIDCIGLRRVGFIGAFVLGFGQAASAFASSLGHLGFTFGILTGILQTLESRRMQFALCFNNGIHILR